MAIAIANPVSGRGPSLLSNDARSIFENALAPDEWNSREHEVICDAASMSAAHAAVERWKKVIETRAGNPEAFKKRLQVLGLSEANAHTRFLKRRLAEVSRDAWALFVEAVLRVDALECAAAMEWLGEEAQEEREAFDIGRSPAPRFPEFLAPFVARFRTELYARASERFSSEHFSDAALASIGRSLFRRLSSVCGRTIAYELRLARDAGDIEGETPEARYRVFVDSRLAPDGERRKILLRYPVLARMLATLSLNMAEAAGEVMERFARDRAEIVRRLNGEGDPGRITVCFAVLSDMHNGGRAAWVLEFENGTRVVYKPRSHDADAAWASVTEWLAGKSEAFRWRTPWTVARHGYGWSEYIESAECASREQVARYFRRQGHNAALIYYMCGQDFHAENFIACGEFPVAIDVEGILSPTVANPPSHLEDFPPELHSLQFTVANTLCLPYWRGGDRHRPLYVASGIGGTGDRNWPTKTPRWKDVDTDSFGIEYVYQPVRFDSSVPRWQGRPVQARDFAADIEAGFRECWTTIATHREEFTHDENLMGRLRRLEGRLLFRDTQDYENLLFWTTAPDILGSGTAYDVALEMLAGSVPVFFTGESFPELIDEEKTSLWRRDIPIATAHASDTAIEISKSRRFGPVIPRPMFEQMIERIGRASDEDLERQCAIIRSLFEMSVAPVSSAGSTSPENKLGRLLDCAVSIGDALERTAMRHGDHTGWLGLARFAGAGARIYPVPTDPWSLNGDAGNALYLINLACATSDTRFERTGRAALKSAMRTLSAVMKGAHAQAVGASAFYGYFGLVYALAAAGTQLEDEELLRDAARLALDFPADLRDGEANPDFLTGAAGPAAVLTWLNRLAPNATLIDSARSWAEAIFRCAREGGREGWQTPYFRRPLLGAAHGSAGIATSLLNLYSETGETKYLNAARAGFEHERRHFRAEDGQWPNLQEDPDRISYMTGWCAGAAGIGLLRLAALEIVPGDPAIAAEVSAAVSATRRNIGGIQHHLCCGESGRIGFLAAASQARQDRLMHAEAVNAAEKMIGQFEQQTLWNLQEFCERMTVPGLMAGVPGIGLTLLYLLRPSCSKVLALC